MAIGASFLVPESFEKVFDLKYDENMYDPTQDKYLTKEEYLKIAKEHPGRLVVLFNPPRKKWLPYWLRMPHMTVASHAIYYGLSWDATYDQYQGYPRTAGTRSKVFRMGREQGVPLMFTMPRSAVSTSTQTVTPASMVISAVAAGMPPLKRGRWVLGSMAVAPEPLVQVLGSDQRSAGIVRLELRLGSNEL